MNVAGFFCPDGCECACCQLREPSRLRSRQIALFVCDGCGEPFSRHTVDHACPSTRVSDSDAAKAADEFVGEPLDSPTSRAFGGVS